MANPLVGDARAVAETDLEAAGRGAGHELYLKSTHDKSTNYDSAAEVRTRPVCRHVGTRESKPLAA